MLNIIQIICLATRNSDKDRIKRLVLEYKKEKWIESFEKANGDVERTYEIYTKDAYFC